MRFSLQDIKKSIQRRDGHLSMALHLLRPGELHHEIERLIMYHEHLLGRPQRCFSLDDARACIGEYHLAHCLIATLSYWYSWRQREWAEVLQESDATSALANISSSVQLRLALYNYVNEHYQGFLETQIRADALQSFAQAYCLSISDLEYLLILDSEEEALLMRNAAQPPGAQEVATLYNQWAFESALFNASNVHFVIDCNTFSNTQQEDSHFTTPVVGTGVGASIKRLCYLARLLGVYYDLAYDPVPLEASSIKEQRQASNAPMRLHLTLYGPQEVTGVPQQYGLRLARLCRLLMGYGLPKTERGRAKKASLASAIMRAEATVHWSQRSYTFVMDANLLQLLPPVAETNQSKERTGPSTLFDSNIEQAFCEAFLALAGSQGVDGWQLEREPEPLLLDHGIFIPDFALTRARRRIYVEILGFGPLLIVNGRSRKLQQLQGRDDLLLAIPVEAKEAFASIAPYFPIVVYNEQLSVTEVLQVLRNRYDDFAERLAQIDIGDVRARVTGQSLLAERTCYEVLHCYRRSEIQRAAEQIVDFDIVFVPGIGFYHYGWMEQVKFSLIEWMRMVGSMRLEVLLQEIRCRWPVLGACEDATLEGLLALWPQVQIRRDSIFDAHVEIVYREAQGVTDMQTPLVTSEKEIKKTEREKRITAKKRIISEATQEDLWR